MFFEKFQRSWHGLRAENQWSRIIIGALLLALVFTSAKAFVNDPIIILTPPTLESVAEIRNRSTDESFKKAWALFVADLMGSITPANVDFVVESLGNHLSPSVYSAVRDSLYDQARDIKREGLTVSFSPREIVYEQSTDKLFVYGVTRTQGRDGRAESVDRTYEFLIAIRQYRPTVTRLSVYRGPPLTAERQAQMATQDAAQKAGGIESGDSASTGKQ